MAINLFFSFLIWRCEFRQKLLVTIYIGVCADRMDILLSVSVLTHMQLRFAPETVRKTDELSLELKHNMS